MRQQPRTPTTGRNANASGNGPGARRQAPAAAAAAAAAPPPPPSSCPSPCCEEGAPCACCGCVVNTLCPPGIMTRTHVLCLVGFLLDAASLAFLIGAVVSPWVTSTSPATVPFNGGTTLSSASLSWSLLSAGTLNGGRFVPVGDPSIVSLVNTSKWTNWFYVPSSVAWSELNDGTACAPSSPLAGPWGARYGWCNPASNQFVGVPSVLPGTQAAICLAACFSGLSMLMMIAARKGSTGWAQASTVFSFFALLCTCIGMGVFYASWSYAQQQISTFVGIIPIRAVASSGLQQVLLPVAATMTYGGAFVLGVFACVFQGSSMIVSWTVASERFFYRATRRDLEALERTKEINELDADLEENPDRWYDVDDVMTPTAELVHRTAERQRRLSGSRPSASAGASAVPRRRRGSEDEDAPPSTSHKGAKAIPPPVDEPPPQDDDDDGGGGGGAPRGEEIVPVPGGDGNYYEDDSDLGTASAKSKPAAATSSSSSSRHHHHLAQT